MPWAREEVMTGDPFEIPRALRDPTEQNMKQAHAAYEQLAHFMIKAIDAWMSAPSNSMVADFNLTGFEDVQNRAGRDGNQECRLGFRPDRKDRQGTHVPGRFDTSDTVRSRADASLRCAYAGASTADRGSLLPVRS